VIERADCTFLPLDSAGEGDRLLTHAIKLTGRSRRL